MENLEKKKSGKKVLKIVLIVVALMIVMFLIHTTRNYIIIKNLQNKISKYSNSTNYYVKSIANEKDGTIVTTKYYKKGNKEAVFLERDIDGDITKMSMYNNGERTDVFIEDKDSKIAELNKGTLAPMNIYNYLETENDWHTLIGSVGARVKSTKYNGKECYLVSGFMSSTSLTFEGMETYIDKDTGLAIKTTADEIVTEKEHEFNNIDDSIFIEPDISQYTLK